MEVADGQRREITRNAQQRYVIDDCSKVGEARRAAQTLANFEFDRRDRRQGRDRGHGAG